MNTRRFSAVPLITAAIMALAAGCSTAGSNAASTTAAYQPEEPDITVAAIPAVDLVGLYIAQDDGLFAQQGLHVTIEKIPSSQAIIADQLKGQVDITPEATSLISRRRRRGPGSASSPRRPCWDLAPARWSSARTRPSRPSAGLAGRKIGVNGTNSIGTLLVSALLAENGVSPRKVDFVTDQEGFPSMPGQLRDGAWAAAFLAEPYITVAGEEYGEQVLADLDQGATLNFPIDGYVATQAWAQKYPKTAAAFVRAIEEGQTIANSDAAAVQAAMAQVRQTAAPSDRGHGAVRLSDRPSERDAHPARRPGHAPVRHARQAIRH